MKRSLSFILAALLLSSAFLTGCAESTTEANTEPAASENAADPNATEAEELETDRMYADIPADTNLDGYTYTILCSSNSEYGIVVNDFYAEEITGEPINDAMYNRNLMAQDKLNVTINAISTHSDYYTYGTEYIEKDVQGGTHAYDLATLSVFSCTALTMENTSIT